MPIIGLAALTFSSMFASMHHSKALGGYWDYTMERRGLTILLPADSSAILWPTPCGSAAVLQPESEKSGVDCIGVPGDFITVKIDLGKAAIIFFIAFLCGFMSDGRGCSKVLFFFHSFLFSGGY